MPPVVGFVNGQMDIFFLNRSPVNQP